jgi:hypothetical protein
MAPAAGSEGLQIGEVDAVPRLASAHESPCLRCLKHVSVSGVIARRFRVRRQLNDATRRQLGFDPSDSLAGAGIPEIPASDHLGIGDAHNGVSFDSMFT